MKIEYPGGIHGRRRVIHLLNAATTPTLKVAAKKRKKKEEKKETKQIVPEEQIELVDKHGASEEPECWFSDDPWFNETETGQEAEQETYVDEHGVVWTQVEKGVWYGRPPKSTPEPSVPPKPSPVQDISRSASKSHRDPDDKLVARLEQAGVWPKDARRLAAQHPETAIDHWVEQAQLWGEGVTNPGGWIRTALDKPWKLPDWVLEPERLQERLAEAVWSSASPEDKHKILAEAKAENGEVCRLARDIWRMVPTWKPSMDATAAIDYLLRTRVNR